MKNKENDANYHRKIMSSQTEGRALLYYACFVFPLNHYTYQRSARKTCLLANIIGGTRYQTNVWHYKRTISSNTCFFYKHGVHKHSEAQRLKI